MARLTVRIQPGARTSKFVGWYGEHPKLAVAAPPVDGAANEEAIRTIASVFGMRRRDVRLVIGRRSRTKHFELDGVDEGRIRATLDELLG